MELYVYGAGKNGLQILNVLKEKYIGWEIRCFIDQEKTGVLCGKKILPLNDIVQTDIPVLISLGDIETAIYVNKKLKKHGFKKIFWYSPKDSVYSQTEFWQEQCISCAAWKGIAFPQVEMHIMDACNLNCRGCTHFSPVFENKIPDMNARLKDVDKLRSKVGHIVKFYILGGEPFMNDQIGKYAIEITKRLPATEICIVTNGLLIPQAEEEILHDIKSVNARISISEYEPTHKKIEVIRERLEQFGILYDIREAGTKQKFNIPLSLSADSGREKCCISNGCITVWNGKIARCPTLMYIGEFNKKFDTNLPKDGIYSLDECPSGEELKRMLKEEVPLCSHCVKNETDWGICGKNPRLEDFAAAD